MGGPDPDRGEADQSGNGPYARPEQDRQLREKNEEKVMLREINPEEAVLKAWNRGERSITQIMELSGCSYKQVRKYIPETKEG